MKDIKTFIKFSINESFNEKEHLELKKEFIKEVGDYWDQFVDFIFSKIKKNEWNKYRDKTRSSSLWDFLGDVKKIDYSDIATAINCNEEKLQNFMEDYDKELSFTIGEFIGYNKRI